MKGLYSTIKKTWNNVRSVAQNQAYGKRTDSLTILLGLTLVVIVIVYILMKKKRRNVPPGPTGVPILGYYPFLNKNPMQTLTELGKKYGNIFGLYLGPQYVVVLNDWETVKDALGQNTTLDRPEELFAEVPYKLGFGGTNGKEWSETRRLASKLMKDGLQRNNWEDLIQVEISDTTERLAQKNGHPIEARSFLADGFANHVISLIIGDLPELTSARNSITKMVSMSVDFIMEYSRVLDMKNFSQTLGKFLRWLGVEETTMLLQKTEEFSKFVSNTVDSRIHNPDSFLKDTLITRYNEEIENRKKLKDETYITEESLKGTVLTLMVGGSETTRTTILWALIAMANHPDKQRKVQEELDNVLGKDGSVRWTHRSKVPYTLATLLETLRWKTTVPFPGVRLVTKDTEIQGYFIPKGAFILSNFWSLHNDLRYWDHPDQFIPERFLLENGRKVNMAPESFVPFSYGKRNCPGKLLAFMSMLQYFSSLLVKFKVVPTEGDKVKYSEVLGLTYQPRNVELRFIPR